MHICVLLEHYLRYAISADVWGFDSNAVDVLQKMKPVDELLNHRYAILLENSGYIPETETDVSKIIKFRIEERICSIPDILQVSGVFTNTKS